LSDRDHPQPLHGRLAGVDRPLSAACTGATVHAQLSWPSRAQDGHGHMVQIDEIEQNHLAWKASHGGGGQAEEEAAASFDS
jgi:hypothetical protein